MYFNVYNVRASTLVPTRLRQLPVGKHSQDAVHARGLRNIVGVGSRDGAASSYTGSIVIFRRVPTLPFSVSCQLDAGGVSGGNMRTAYRYTRRRSMIRADERQGSARGDASSGDADDEVIVQGRRVIFQFSFLLLDWCTAKSTGVAQQRIGGAFV